MGNFTVNGHNFQASQIRELQAGVNMEQALDATFNDGHDSIIFEQDGKEYIAWGDEVELSELSTLEGTDFYQVANIEAQKNGQKSKYNTMINSNSALAPRDKVQGLLNGKAINVIIIENEVNSSGEGLDRAFDAGKTAGKWVLGQAKDSALGIAGAGMTLGMYARWGGSKVAAKVVATGASQVVGEASKAVGKSFVDRAGTWAFGPAKDLTFQAGKGFKKAAKVGAIVVGVAAVVGTSASVIQGGNRTTDDSAMKSITK